MGFTITVQELKQKLDKGEKVVLIDVREPWEYNIAKIQGAQLIPLGTLGSEYKKLDPQAEIFKHRFSPIINLSTKAAPKYRLKKLRALADDVGIFGLIRQSPTTKSRAFGRSGGNIPLSSRVHPAAALSSPTPILVATGRRLRQSAAAPPSSRARALRERQD